MWQKIIVDSKEYITKSIVNDQWYEINFSDMINIWKECIQKENITARFKELNPLLEAPPKSMVDHVLSLLDTTRTDVQRSIREFPTELALSLNARMSILKFTFNFKLQKQPPEILYKEVTLPLLMMVQELSSQHDKLCMLLNQKDKEIAEYKLEGGQLSRKNIETAVFNKEAFTASALAGVGKRSAPFRESPTSVFIEVIGPLFMAVPTHQPELEEPEMAVEVQSPAKSSSPKKNKKSGNQEAMNIGGGPGVQHPIRCEETMETESGSSPVKTKKTRPKTILKL